MIALVLGLALIGLALYLIERFIPIDPVILTVIRVVVVVAVILFLIRIFGIADLPVPRVR